MATGRRNPRTDADPEASHSGRSTSGRADTSYFQNTTNMQFTVDKMTLNNAVILTRQVYMGPTEPPDPNDEALRERPPPEDLSYLFKPEDLERDVEERFLVPVAKAFREDKECRLLALKLKIEAPTMKDLNMRHDRLDERVYQVIMTWKRINPQVKVGDLVTALCSSRNQRQARVLKDVLEQNS